MKLKLFAGAVALISIGAGPLPAVAATLALDFAPTPGSYTPVIVSDQFVQSGGAGGLGWQFSLSSTATVTGLAGFDGGSSANIPNGTGDLISLYKGSITTNQSLLDTSIKNALIASALVGGSTGGTQLNAWLYNGSPTTANGNTLTLGPGNYFILDTYNSPNTPNNMAGAPNNNTGKTTNINQLISVIAGLTWTSEVICDANSQCTEPVPAPVGSPPVQGYGLFGPTFLVSDAIGGGGAGAAPLPAALPLFAGGLGVIGLLARRRKQKKTAA
jgi:hypothetical protein